MANGDQCLDSVRFANHFFFFLDQTVGNGKTHHRQIADRFVCANLINSLTKKNFYSLLYFTRIFTEWNKKIQLMCTEE